MDLSPQTLPIGEAPMVLSSTPFRRPALPLRSIGGGRAWTVAGLLLCLLLLGRNALAQPTDRSPVVQEVVPPQLLEGIPPEYPKGATGAARIIVEAVLATDGHVEKSTAVDGEGPFKKLAEEAVLHYRFSPALRGSLPVRARVRLVVTFDPPEPEPPQTPSSPSEPEPSASANPAAKPSPVAPPPPPPPPEAVSVTGRRYETSTPTEHRMGRAEVRLLPGAFGDAFRAVEILPGVVPTVSGLPYFYVRGAPPAAVGYFVDEVRVPYLFHFGLGPSVIEPALVKEVTLHPAAYPARYGRFAGGVVAGETNDPSPVLKGEALIRLYDAGAFVEVPFANGNGQVALGGRYSYTGLLFSLASPDLTVSYRDYNARVSYRLSERLRLTAFAFGSYDYASQKRNDVEKVFFASEFHRLDVRLDHEGEKSHSRIAATFGLDRTRLQGSRFARDYLLGVRARHRVSLSDWAEVEAGADVLVDLFQGDVPSPYAVLPQAYDRQVALYSPHTDSSSGAWFSALLRPAKKLDVSLTARADLFSSAGALAVGPSPRATVRVPLTERFAGLFAVGVAPQPPAFSTPLPAVGYRGLPGGLSYAYQKSAGVEVKLPLGFVATAVGFHHTYFNLLEFLSADGSLDDLEGERRTNSRGQAFGLELFLQRKMTNRVSATLSYTLSRNVVGSTNERSAALNRFDRAHVLQAALAVDLTRGWFASLRSVVYSGWPDKNSVDRRLPPFFRFDARLEKRWRWGTDGHVSLLVEGLNVTGSKEALSQKCTESGCKVETLGPIVAPSIGVEGAL